MSSTIEFLPPAATRVLIADNPRAGTRSGRPIVNRLLQLLREASLEAEVHGEAETLQGAAAEALAAGRLRAIVAAGGDGTAAMVVNCTPPGTPLMALPLGTENLLAKHLDLAADADQACRTILRGATIRLDAGSANGRIFLLMLGCGLDAEVVQRLHAGRTGNIGRLSYVKPILDCLRSYEYPELRVYCDHRPETESGPSAGGPARPIVARWAFVANLPCYAGGLKIVPQADGADGMLDLCTFQRGSWWNGLRYLGGVVLGRHRAWEECVSLRTRRLRIESDEPVCYQLDGDPGGRLPVEVRVLPERVTILAPERWAVQRGFQLAAG